MCGEMWFWFEYNLQQFFLLRQAILCTTYASDMRELIMMTQNAYEKGEYRVTFWWHKNLSNLLRLL